MNVPPKRSTPRAWLEFYIQWRRLGREVEAAIESTRLWKWIEVIGGRARG